MEGRIDIKDAKTPQWALLLFGWNDQIDV